MTVIQQRQLLERMVNRLVADDQATATTKDLAREADKLLRDVRSFNAAMSLPLQDAGRIEKNSLGPSLKALLVSG